MDKISYTEVGKYVIYKLNFNTSKKCYVGQSRQLKLRLWKYENLMCERQPKLYNALKKYGWEDVSVEILHSSDDMNQHQLNVLEIEEIKKQNSIQRGYNIHEGGHLPQSKESIEKRKATMKEKMKDPTFRKKMSDAQRQKYIDNPELRAVISKIHTDRFSNPNERKLQSERIKLYFKNNPDKSDEHSEFMKKYWKENGTQQISNGMCEYYKDPESREKASKCQKERFSKKSECDSMSERCGGSEFTIIHKNGEIYRGISQGLCARELNLSQGNLSAVIRGNRMSHKGWKLYTEN